MKNRFNKLVMIGVLSVTLTGVSLYVGSSIKAIATETVETEALPAETLPESEKTEESTEKNEGTLDSTSAKAESETGTEAATGTESETGTEATTGTEPETGTEAATGTESEEDTEDEILIFEDETEWDPESEICDIDTIEVGVTDPVQILGIDIATGVYSLEGFSVNPLMYPAADVTANTKEIYQFLVNEMGLNHAAACGILANIHLESGFNPMALGDGGTSYGICQWHLGRFSALVNYCKANNYDYNTLEGQLHYLYTELQGGYSGVLNYIASVPDTEQGAYDAAYYWCMYFEIPDNTQSRSQQRGNLAANEYYVQSFEVTVEEQETTEVPFDREKSMEEILGISLIPNMLNV